MALIVEDGTGKDDAESYVSVEDADAFHAARGNAAWAALDGTAKEVALRKATEYIDGNYYGRWRGRAVSATQALAWPRADACVDGNDLPDDAVPRGIIRACSYAAGLAGSGTDLQPVLERGGYVKKFREKVDVIEEETEYFSGAPSMDRLVAIENYVRPYLSSGSSSTRRLIRG